MLLASNRSSGLAFLAALGMRHCAAQNRRARHTSIVATRRCGVGSAAAVRAAVTHRVLISDVPCTLAPSGGVAGDRRAGRQALSGCMAKWAFSSRKGPKGVRCHVFVKGTQPPSASPLLAWCARAQGADLVRAQWRLQEILRATAVGAQNENSPPSTSEARPLRGVAVRMPPDRAPCACGQWVLLRVTAY